MSRQLLVYTPFNAAKMNSHYYNSGKGKEHVTLSHEWILKRYNFWKDNTLKSLQNQTFQDFLVYMHCDYRTKDICEEYLLKADPRVRILYVTWGWEQEDLDNARASKELHRIEIDKLNNTCTDFILVRLDSDDLYSKDALQLIVNNTDNYNHHCMFNHGYGQDITTNKYYYYEASSGPFFSTLVSHLEDIDAGNHDAFHHKNPRRLDGRHFMVSHTSSNTSTSMCSAGFKQEISDTNLIETIKKEFGI